MHIWKENVDDAHRYYNNTYVKDPELLGNNDYHKAIIPFNNGLAFKNIVTGETKHFKLYSYPTDKSLVDKAEYKPVILNYVMPLQTMWQSPVGAYLLIRKPAKQYMRGISSSNSIMAVLKSNKLFNWTEKISSYEEFLASFSNKSSFANLDSVMDRRFELESYCLDPFFAINQSGDLYYFDNLVGKINFSNETCSVHNLFRPAVNRMLERQFKMYGFDPKRIRFPSIRERS